jgi:hypothetical protein
MDDFAREETTVRSEMTHDDSAFDAEVELLDPQVDQVYRWRVSMLVRAGYSATFARLLAEDILIDLHAACRLLEQGCTELTAYEILA